MTEKEFYAIVQLQTRRTQIRNVANALKEVEEVGLILPLSGRDTVLALVGLDYIKELATLIEDRFEKIPGVVEVNKDSVSGKPEAIHWFAKQVLGSDSISRL